MSAPPHDLFWFNQATAVDRVQSYFMVLTLGNCGAIWFASALNLHSDIFAGCGIDHPIESCFRYNLNKDGGALLAASAPRHYRFGAHPEVMPQLLRQHGAGFDIPTPRDYERFAWYVFDELEELPAADRYRTLGSVHAYGAGEFAVRHAADATILGGRRVVVVNMIRHPVPRAESFLQALIKFHLEMHQPRIDAYIAGNLSECLTLERRYGIAMDDPRVRAALFMYRINRDVAGIAHELQLFDKMLALKMESLQSDPEYFSSAVELLTSGRVTPTQAYLDEVYKPEHLGMGRRHVADGALPAGPSDQWEQWSDWERDEFLATCVRDGIMRVYEQHGYDFSFVRQPSRAAAGARPNGGGGNA